MSEIDYKALYERVVQENEALRLGMVKDHFQRTRSALPTAQAITTFIEQHYLVLVFGLLLFSSLVAGVYTIWRDSHE